ncbi:hypothetical protein [Alloalcanivorax xenomutans]|uniref:hypothetical protein n=1 Tax=Alloalcanivorax xenomutans TaxID=1094342 RepID=UPI003BABBCEC
MNEAQTRFHIIDCLLKDCLGWDGEIEVEKSEDGLFSDYELGKPRVAVLEAKKEGVWFDIPAGTSRNLKTDIRALSKTSHEAKKAIEQVQSYCASRGVPLAIVCNGRQVFAFIASRQDGVSVFDGKAVVFESLDSMLENFSKLWNFLSLDGVKEKNVFRYLSFGDSGIPNKLSSKLSGYPKVRYPSALQSTLRQLSELFLLDIIESNEVEERFFKECYCESGALSQYSLLSKNVLEARYAALFSSDEPHPRVESVKSKKKDNFSPDILAEAIAKRPIVLLGDVGVGKTSFVKNLIYNSAYEEFRSAIYVYIDLGSDSALSSDIKGFVLDEIERQLFKKYDLDVYEFGFVKGVYASELHRFSRGHWGQKKESDPGLYETKISEKLDELMSKKDQHLKRSLDKYSKSAKKQIIICIDNADQRDYDVQQSAFVISQELAKEWCSTVFISVRPKTFFKSKRAGTLSAYPHKVFTISPPRIDTVINKRLMFALDMAEGNIPIESVDYVRVNAHSLALFLKALISSLKDNGDLYEFLSNITGGNIRSAIQFVSDFIGSPNVDAEKITNIMASKGGYRIPLHEFTKPALLGDYSHYTPDGSMAMNVYDVRSADPAEHFLVPLLVSFLSLPGRHKDNDGFCSFDNIVEELQRLGFTAEQISAALRRSTNRRLIETSQRVTFEEDESGGLVGEMPEAFRVTSSGAYHIQRWLGVFAYLDAMAFDTPIFDAVVRDVMLRNINSLSIFDRYVRAVGFKEYLLKCWDEFSNKPDYFDFYAVIADSSSSFDGVKAAMDKHARSVP